jgi:hypothetical protein
LAWAFTLVNMRQPEIMANFLSHSSEEISGNDAFTDGVYSALILAGETVPGHRFVTGFCRYRPDRREESAVDAWNRHIGSDCETLRLHGKPGEMFRYHRTEILRPDNKTA